MRSLWFLLAIALLLYGCTQNQTVPQQTPNQTNYTPQVSNTTVSVSNQSIPVIASGNISTIPSENSTQTNSTPTLNQTVNASSNSTSNSTQTNQSAIPVGLTFPDSNYSLVLDDVSLVPTSEQPCGIFSIRDAQNNILNKQLICPGQDATWVSPIGHLYHIQVLQVAAGYSTHAEWASVQIFG